jgi:hypothetical protein
MPTQSRRTTWSARARRLYLRARDYGLRGLDTRHHGFTRGLSADPKAAVGEASKGDVALL